MPLLRTLGWLACVVYSTIPLFWLMVHPRAHRWRENERSPFRVLVPAWIVMWIGIGALTGPWRAVAIYSTPWSWIPAAMLFAAGIFTYSQCGSPLQLGATRRPARSSPQRRSRGSHDQRLVTTGIRARVRHPVYLGHLCEMLAWSLGTGLVVCWLLTAFAIVTGAVMIRMEDAELEKRFGDEFSEYQTGEFLRFFDRSKETTMKLESVGDVIAIRRSRLLRELGSLPSLLKRYRTRSWESRASIARFARCSRVLLAHSKSRAQETNA